MPCFECNYNPNATVETQTIDAREERAPEVPEWKSVAINKERDRPARSGSSGFGSSWDGVFETVIGYWIGTAITIAIGYFIISSESRITGFGSYLYIGFVITPTFVFLALRTTGRDNALTTAFLTIIIGFLLGFFLGFIPFGYFFAIFSYVLTPVCTRLIVNHSFK